MTTKEKDLKRKMESANEFHQIAYDNGDLESAEYWGIKYMEYLKELKKLESEKTK
jgi:hypothetical protein